MLGIGTSGARQIGDAARRQRAPARLAEALGHLGREPPRLQPGHALEPEEQRVDLVGIALAPRPVEGHGAEQARLELVARRAELGRVGGEAGGPCGGRLEVAGHQVVASLEQAPAQPVPPAEGMVLGPRARAPRGDTGTPSPHRRPSGAPRPGPGGRGPGARPARSRRDRSTASSLRSSAWTGSPRLRRIQPRRLRGRGIQRVMSMRSIADSSRPRVVSARSGRPSIACAMVAAIRAYALGWR